MEFTICYGEQNLGEVNLRDFGEKKKLSKAKATKIARTLVPIIENYIPEWDRDYQKVTIKETVETMLTDLEHFQYSMEEILDNAVALKDWETVHKLCASGVWSY